MWHNLFQQCRTQFFTNAVFVDILVSVVLLFLFCCSCFVVLVLLLLCCCFVVSLLFFCFVVVLLLLLFCSCCFVVVLFCFCCFVLFLLFCFVFVVLLLFCCCYLPSWHTSLTFLPDRKGIFFNSDMSTLTRAVSQFLRCLIYIHIPRNILYIFWRYPQIRYFFHISPK